MPTLDLTTILARTREIVSDVVAPRADDVDRQARWPEEGLHAIQSAELAGLVVPETYGGLGQGLLGLTLVSEEIGATCASTAMCFGMHCVGTAVIAAKASPCQAEYLERMSAGDHLTTLALSEPQSGAHFYFPQTQLIQTSPDTFRLRGSKAFVTNGGRADSYVISTVAAEPDAPPGQFSCVIVPESAEGMKWGPPWDGLGMRGNCSRSVDLRDVVISRRDLLGEEGDQIWYVFNVIAPYFLMAMAGTYLGLAQAALEIARTHLGRRHYTHSGGTLGQVSILQHRLGTLWGMVERTRQLVHYAASEFDAGGAEALPALFAAKAEVADCVVSVVNEAMTLTGGSTYQDCGRLGRLLRDARAAHVMSPTTDILRTWTGRALLGQPLLGE